MLKNHSTGSRVVRVGLSFGLVAAGVLGLGAFGRAEGEGTDTHLSLAPREAFAAQGPDGAKIYATNCSACHQMGGTGVHGMFPPLVGSDWVTGDAGRVIRVVLHGLTGDIVVNGEEYSGTMAPFGGALKDAEVAAVVNYIRTNFTNKASPVTAATVAKIRAETGTRKKPWTAKELDALSKSAPKGTAAKKPAAKG